jgi:hypothetical protein
MSDWTPGDDTLHPRGVEAGDATRVGGGALPCNCGGAARCRRVGRPNCCGSSLPRRDFFAVADFACARDDCLVGPLLSPHLASLTS